MASLNKIMVIGNVGSDPEMRFTPNGASVTNFSLATNRKYNVAGEQKDATTWFHIVCWSKLAETCNQYLAKGKQVYVEGRLEIRKWTDKEEIEKTSVEIIANTVLFLGAKEKAEVGVEPEESEIPF